MPKSGLGDDKNREKNEEAEERVKNGGEALRMERREKMRREASRPNPKPERSLLVRETDEENGW